VSHALNAVECLVSVTLLPGAGPAYSGTPPYPVIPGLQLSPEDVVDAINVTLMVRRCSFKTCVCKHGVRRRWHAWLIACA